MYSTIWYVYTIDDTIDSVSRSLTNYYTLNDISPDSFGYPYPNGTTTNPSMYPTVSPTLTVVSYTDTSSMFNPTRRFQPTTSASTYTLNSSYLGPIDPNYVAAPDLRSFFHTLVSMTLTFPPINSFAYGSVYRNCFTWSVSVNYDFTNRGQIHVTMDQEILGTCDIYPSTTDALLDKALWLNTLIILLSVIHSLLLLKSVFRSIKLMFRLQSWAREQSNKLHIVADQLSRREAALSSTLPNEKINSPDLGLQSTGMRLGPINNTNNNNNNKNTSDLNRSLLLDDSLQNNTVASGKPPLSKKVTKNDKVDVSFHSNVLGDGGSEFLVTVKTKSNDGTTANTMVFSPGVDDINLQGDIKTSAQMDARTLAAAAEALDMQWAKLPLRDKLRLINGWAILSLVADACNISTAILNLQDRNAHIPQDENRSLAMGIGASLLWIGILRYAEHNREYFNIILTIRRAGPRVLRFLVGVLPVFVAYTLFAVVVFSDRIPRFADMRTAFITLFANLNGDVVRETFMAIVAYHPVVGQFFFYTFISLHIYVILNVVVAVVEESYFLTIQKGNDYAAKIEEAEEDNEETTEDTTIEPNNNNNDVDQGILPVLAATLPQGIDILGTPAKADSHSVKERPDSKLAVLLRLSEWDEVVTGKQIG